MLVEISQFDLAGGAPSGPEVQQDPFPAVPLLQERPAVQRSAAQRGSRSGLGQPDACPARIRRGFGPVPFELARRGSIERSCDDIFRSLRDEE